MKNSIKKGFTLVELLVVISIISLLASIVMTSLQSARVKARNTAVQSQVREYISALYQYKTEKGKYPLEEYAYPGSLTDTGWFCLGKSITDGNCGSYEIDAGIYPENQELIDILEKYIPGTPNPNKNLIELNAVNPSFKLGSIYYGGGGGPAFVGWTLEGYVSCGLGAYSYSEINTYCELYLE